MRCLKKSDLGQIAQLLYLGLFVVFIMSSCWGTGELTDSSLSPQQSPSDCHVLEHAAGETCVPISPERLVVLDDCTLEPVLALGIEPIGGPVKNSSISGQTDLSHIQDIGSPPNLEAILPLKPDLILACSYLRNIYNQVAQIAPTVIAPVETSGDWKAVFFLVADALGKTDTAGQWMESYNARLKMLRSQLEFHPNSIEVSVIRVYPDRITLYAKDIFIGTILDDVDLSRPPSQNRNVPVIDISKESIQQADGDVIFMWTYGSNEQLAESAQSALVDLKTDPLWQQLNAVKQNKVYVVPDYWIGAGPLSANAVIDDLFEYLANQSESNL